VFPVVILVAGKQDHMMGAFYRANTIELHETELVNQRFEFSFALGFCRWQTQTLFVHEYSSGLLIIDDGFDLGHGSHSGIDVLGQQE
jgi:hypothetical protein